VRVHELAPRRIGGVDVDRQPHAAMVKSTPASSIEPDDVPVDAVADSQRKILK
jgi:hypothetical protein